jgi:hypothetical protein
MPRGTEGPGSTPTAIFIVLDDHYMPSRTPSQTGPADCIYNSRMPHARQMYVDCCRDLTRNRVMATGSVLATGKRSWMDFMGGEDAYLI